MSDLVHGWAELPALNGCYVYALLGADDQVLYIGRSTNALGRLGTHLSDPSKRRDVARILVKRCASQAEMCAAELQLINAYCPPWNVVGLPLDQRRQRPRKQIPALVVQLSPRPWMTPDQVADRLGCSLDDVKQHVDAGRLEASGHGQFRHLRFKPEWVDLLLARGA